MWLFYRMNLKLKAKKVATISVCALVFGVINGFLIFPGLLKFMLKRSLQLQPGSQLRLLFENIPFPVTFKIYIFNITNAGDVTTGSKPILQEIGPYIFDEWKVRQNIKDDDLKDTVSYDLINRFIFRPDLSNGLTGNEEVTFPHLIMLGGIMAIKRDREELVPFAVEAMKSLFNPTSSFVNVRVFDFLFDGFAFNCESSDFSAKTVCAAIKSEVDGVKIINETHLSISLLGHKNGTSTGRFEIFRGVKNIADMGRVFSFNGNGLQSVWDGDECNRVKGTDSTIFPPFLNPDEGLWAFSPDICMSLQAKYLRKSSYAGLPTSYYSIDFGDIKNEPLKHCFCYNPDVCPPKGTLDLFDCVGSPIYGSKPHFLDADLEVAGKIEGLNSSRKLHDIYVNFEAITGTPLEGAKRLQFNMELCPVEGFEIMRKLPEALLPLLWVEESVKLNKTYTNLLKYRLFLAKNLNSTIKWIAIVGGIAGLIFSGFMMHSKGAKTAAVTSSVELNESGNLKYLSEDCTSTNDSRY